MNAACIPESVAAVLDRLKQTVDEAGLSHAARLSIAVAVHQMIVPKRKPGKSKDRRLDKAYGEYRAGMCRLELFRKHIPRHDRLSRWRRKAEETRLLKALQKRTEREKKRQQTATIRTGELSARQFAPGNCRADNSA